jgi:hypothetical protein
MRHLPIVLPEPASGAMGAPVLTRLSQPLSLALARRIFSFPIMLGCLLVSGAFYWACKFEVDPDFWWHLKVGDQILATHHWPTTDPYSFTTGGQPWLAYEWLGDVLFSFTNHIGGIRGLEALFIVLGGAIVLGLYGLTTLRTENSKAAFIATTILMLLASASMTLRPQMLGYFFLILTLILLERFRQGKSRELWVLPILFLVWVNTHGSWIIGLGTVLAYWVGGVFNFRIGGIEARPWSPKERRQLSFVFLLCLCVLPFTPYGTELCAYPFEVASSLPLNVAHISEWQSMPFNLLGGQIFLGLVLGFLIVQMALRLTWRLEELGLFLFGAMTAFLHVRFLLIFVPFFAPLLATIIARWVIPYKPAKDKFILNFALMAMMLGGIVHYFPSRSDLQNSVAQRLPSKAVDYINENFIPGPMYNSYGFGGYLVWARGPEHKVFVDGRGELYERGGVLRDYLYISELKPGALSVLRKYRIQSCLIQYDEPLATLLAVSPEWERIYVDNVSAIFVRRDPAASQTLVQVHSVQGRKE